MKNQLPMWPAWYYSPDGEGKVFNHIQDVPYGWLRHKPKEFTSADPLSIDKDSVVQELNRREIKIDPRWGKAHLKKVLDDISPPR